MTLKIITEFYWLLTLRISLIFQLLILSHYWVGFLWGFLRILKIFISCVYLAAACLSRCRLVLGSWLLRAGSLLKPWEVLLAMQNLVSWPEIQLRLPALGAWSPGHWTIREVKGYGFNIWIWGTHTNSVCNMVVRDTKVLCLWQGFIRIYFILDTIEE